MKSHPGKVNFLFPKLIKNFLSKMKACSWSSSTSSFSGINSLIPFTVSIIILTPDVWWKRNMAITLKPGFINRRIKLNSSEFTSLLHINNYSDASIRKPIFIVLLYFLCTLNHCVPGRSITNGIQKHEFLFTSTCCFCSVASGPSNAAIIENHESSWCNKINNLRHAVMFNSTRNFIQVHEFVITTFTRRSLCN